MQALVPQGQGEEMPGLKSQTYWFYTVSMGKWLPLSEPHFLIYKMG